MTESTRRLGRRPQPAPVRFWPKVDRRGPDDCWPWTGGTANGYGLFRVSPTERTSAHGYALLLATGVVCPPGHQPLHTCKTPDTPLCCNPAHVRYARPGAFSIPLRGDANPACKVSDADVAEIRRRAHAGERNIDLAAEFGVTPVHISHIKCGVRRTAVVA